MKIVLFDVDGTLLLTDGAGRRAIQASLREQFGGDTGPVDLWFDGKTDPQIIRELMRTQGHHDEAIDANMSAVLERYLNHLDRELLSPSHFPALLRGVAELLDELESRSDVVLGLLTGNLERGAQAKLRRVGVQPERFRVGAYGSDHELRSELPGIARLRARQMLGADIAGSAVVVIGDTPADISCGRGIGARAIGVATGRYTVAELASHGPAAVFENLAPTAAVLEAIVGD